LIKSAVVGCGYLGRFHADKYHQSPNAELVAVMDVNEENGKGVATKLGVPFVSSLQELIPLGVQCASVASTTSTHFEIAKWLLENGIDVLLEKPMTTTTAEAYKLVEIAHEKKRILQIGHLERFNPAFIALKQHLTEPKFFEAKRISVFTGRGADVDVVRDLMIHDIDILCNLAQSEITSIDAVGTPVVTNSVDIANARIRFKNGAVANVTSSRVALQSERTIRIFQPNTYIVIDFGEKTLRIFNKLETQDERGLPKIDIQKHAVDESDALRDEIEAFLSAVRDRSQPLVTGEDGIRAIKLVEMINSAMSVNSPVIFDHS
jgi:predicted dehydrogenase